MVYLIPTLLYRMYLATCIVDDAGDDDGGEDEDELKVKEGGNPYNSWAKKM